jgi:hypothetical protein
MSVNGQEVRRLRTGDLQTFSGSQPSHDIVTIDF